MPVSSASVLPASLIGDDSLVRAIEKLQNDDGPFSIERSGDRTKVHSPIYKPAKDVRKKLQGYNLNAMADTGQITCEQVKRLDAIRLKAIAKEEQYAYQGTAVYRLERAAERVLAVPAAVAGCVAGTAIGAAVGVTASALGYVGASVARSVARFRGGRSLAPQFLRFGCTAGIESLVAGCVGGTIGGSLAGSYLGAAVALIGWPLARTVDVVNSRTTCPGGLKGFASDKKYAMRYVQF